jgi:hypothetical protein
VEVAPDRIVIRRAGEEPEPEEAGDESAEEDAAGVGAGEALEPDEFDA